MPIHRTKSGGYQFGDTGKVYYGKDARQKALKQGQAISISKKNRKGERKVKKDLMEEKITEYKGYSIYQVDHGDYEIWHLGQRVMRTATEKEAREWIDDQETFESIKKSAKLEVLMKGLSEGKSFRDLMEADSDLGKLRTDFIQAMNALIGSWMSLYAAYENLEDADPEFVNLFAEEYPFDKSFDDLQFDIISWRDYILEKFVK